MKNRVLLCIVIEPFAVSLAGVGSENNNESSTSQVGESLFSLITKQTGVTVAYSRTIVNPERIVSVQAKTKTFLKYWMIYSRVQM